jgi:pimeloyl-ACP methyl ester carboxylesterase
VQGWLGRPVWGEARSIRELRLLRQSAWWQGYQVPEGKNRPVLLIAGFLAGPRTIDALDHVLSVAGWRVRQAEVGRNAGPAYHGIAHCERDLAALQEDSDQKVRVIGHSRGGQYARVLAVRFPQMIEQIITLGSPLRVKYPKYAVVKVPAEALDRLWRTGVFGAVDTEAEERVDEDRFVSVPDGINFVSVYSKTDGIVDWRTSIDPQADMIEVNASHAGLPNSIAGVAAVAAALARL